MSSPLTLAELIDLERRFLEDRGRDVAELRVRDAAVAAELAEGPLPDRHEVFRRWLAGTGDDQPSAGHRVQAYYRLAGLVMAALAFLSGAATARAVLHYDGRDPVNVLAFLAVFVVLQVSLVALSVLFMLPRRWFGWLPGSGAIQDVLRGFGYRRSGIEPLLARVPGGAHVAPTLGRARAWHAIYADVERWTLAALTQRTALLFNLGALATCVYLISVSALAFSWSTTLDVDDAAMTRVFHAVAVPWSWASSAVPDAELVAASRYFPGARYDPDALGDWWAFLLAALICYGLLPRALLAAFAARRAHAARNGLALDHAACEAAYERLTRGRRGWSGDAAADDPSADGGGPALTGAEPELPAGGEDVTCAVVRWADAVLADDEARALVRSRFGWGQVTLHDAGGRNAPEAVTALGALADLAGDSPIVVVAEAWEAPAKSLLHFLTELRAAAGVRRPVVVALLAGDPGERSAPDDEDFTVWRRRLTSLGDPYLRVEALTSP